MILIPNIDAAYEQGTDINVRITCTILNCSQEYNVTVEDPDGSILLDLAPTSIQAGYLNFTLNSTQTAQSGTYTSFLIGENGEPSLYTFDVTPNGEVPTEANAIFYIGLLALLTFFFAILAYFGMSSESIWIRAAALGFGYLFLIGISFVAWNMAADFITSSPFLVTFLYWAFIVLMIGFFPFLLILFAYGIYMMVTVKEIKDMIERGIPENEAAERQRWKK
jgi:hypothetical protein